MCSFRGIGPSLAILFARFSTCAEYLKMSVTVPHKTDFEQRATAQIHSLSGCGFPSESLPLVVNVALVNPSFPKLAV